MADVRRPKLNLPSHRFKPCPWLEQRQNEVEKAKLHYKDAARVAPHIHEPHYNFALLAYKAGDIHTAYTEASTFDLQLPVLYTPLESAALAAKNSMATCLLCADQSVADLFPRPR